MPELAGETDLTIRFPAVGLPDWIRYKLTAAGKLEDDGLVQGGGTLEGRSARQAPNKDFAHGSIMLLLESPHDKEMKAGRPASGTTGRNITASRSHLEAFLAPFIRQMYPSPAWKSIPLVISNPCPYPTSCLATVGTWFRFRDLVFERLFPLVQDDFYARLVRYRPCFIMNACTSGTRDDGGNIVFPDPNGGQMILQGDQTASPKELVEQQINRYVRKRDFWRSAAKLTSTGFDLETPVPAGRVPGGFWIDSPHPVSWRVKA